jgi:hypothetical protein
VADKAIHFVPEAVHMYTIVTEGAKNNEMILQISGIDVMITIFCDFCLFSEKNLAFFSKTNFMIKFLHNLALFRVKNANFFADFLGENIFKIITSVPDLNFVFFRCVYIKSS